MKNAVYGKTMKNLRYKIDVRLVRNEKGYLKWTSKPSFMSQKIFENNLVALLKSKVRLTFNKPAYVGMCVLDLSKVLMCKFHYDYIRHKYGKNSRLSFTDTDSMMYEIKTEEFYENVSKDKEMLDVSNHLPKSKYYYDDSNKVGVCKMKDETSGATIKKIVGLKLKMYSSLV